VEKPPVSIFGGLKHTTSHDRSYGAPKWRTAGLKPLKLHKSKLKNTDFVSIMISKFYVIYPSAEINN
jgi:hypothetical protein